MDPFFLLVLSRECGNEPGDSLTGNNKGCVFRVIFPHFLPTAPASLVDGMWETSGNPNRPSAPSSRVVFPIRSDPLGLRNPGSTGSRDYRLGRNMDIAKFPETVGETAIFQCSQAGKQVGVCVVFSVLGKQVTFQRTVFFRLAFPSNQPKQGQLLKLEPHPSHLSHTQNPGR